MPRQTRDREHEALAQAIACLPSIKKMLFQKYAKHSGDVEDILQETLIRVSKQCKSQAPESMIAFMTTIASRLMLDFGRSSYPRRVVLMRGEEVNGFPDYLLTCEAPEESDPAVEMHNDALIETRQRITAEIIAALPARQRELYVMRANGYSQKQIARALAISENTVEHHLSKMHRRIRHVVQSYRVELGFRKMGRLRMTRWE
jgi:RNA polymerase sigma factor (sigma-70 family)